MKPVLSNPLKKIKQLLNFHKPRFRHLDCIDLVLENKLLLLISWDAAHANKIRIRPGKAVYHKHAGAAIVKLPAGTSYVHIIIHNLWRSTKISFPLKRVAVDQQTLEYIGKHFQTVPDFHVIHIQPIISSPPIQLNNQLPQLLLNIKAPAFTLSINQHQLNNHVA